MGPLRLYSIIFGSLAGASLVVGYLLASRRKSPEQRERERRARINTIGRITDGTVQDVCELPAGNGGHSTPVQLLIFNYDVAGGSYEASPDITHLRQHIKPTGCKIGG